MYYTEKRIERNIVNLLKVFNKLAITIRYFGIKKMLEFLDEVMENDTF